MIRIYLPYLVSGFVSLVYQVVWYRRFVDQLGAGNITFVLVLCCFIGGLGVGAAVSRRAAPFLQRLLGRRDDLTFYGQIELIIAATALGLFLFSSLPNQVVGDFPYVLIDGIYRPVLYYQFCKIVAVALCVFVPCFFMGITFPLLCATFKRLDQFPSRLYAWNTLGACAGVLASEFVLVRCLGTTVTFCVALLLNTLLGAGFMKYGMSFYQRLVAPATGPASLSRKKASAGTALEEDREPMFLETAVACAIVSGLLSGGIEADVLRRLALWGEHLKISFSFLVFWAILAIFLASSAIRTHRAWRFSAIKVLFLAALAYHVLACAVHLPVRNRIYAFLASQLGGDFYLIGLLQAFISTGLSIFPTYFCISLLLPHTCNYCQRHARHLGAVYGMNTIAFCAGVLVFGWIAPMVNPFYSMHVFTGTFAVCTLYLFTMNEARPPRRLILLPVAAALMLVFLLPPRTFDKDFFGKPTIARYPVTSVRSNGAHLVYVVRLPTHRYLYFDAHPMSGTSQRGLCYMKLMAHFPLLLHPHPRTALLICFGVGNTAKAIADHSPIERLDAVDLSPYVFELAHEFADTNHRVCEDRRVRLIEDDGRNFLALTKNTYDLITSEPPPPFMPGVQRLYSLEYYRACLEHLSPDGIVSQWIPAFQLTSEMIDRMVGTFRAVFPETMMFVGCDEEIILMGSRKPIDLACVERRFAEDKGVIEDLTSLGVTSPAHLFARIFMADETIDKRFTGKGLITDEKNFLEYAVTNVTARSGEGARTAGRSQTFLHGKPALHYDALPLARLFEQQGLRSYPELDRMLRDVDLLLKYVPDFPIDAPDSHESNQEE